MNRIFVLCSAIISLAALNLQAVDDRFSDLEDSSFKITPFSSKNENKATEVSKKVLGVKESKIESDNSLSLPKTEERKFLKSEISDYSKLNSVLNKKTDSIKEKEAVEERPLYSNEKGKKEAENFSLPKSNNANLVYMFLGLTASGILFLVWWYQKAMKKKLHGAGVSVSVLGQTWIDGSTRVILLKVGPKIITLAKSNQFCTPLDIISDPEEVNFLTLSSNIQQEGGGDFKQAFSKAKRQAFKPKDDKIPNSSQMKMELEDLKKQLGQM